MDVWAAWRISLCGRAAEGLSIALTLADEGKVAVRWRLFGLRHEPRRRVWGGRRRVHIGWVGHAPGAGQRDSEETIRRRIGNLRTMSGSSPGASASRVGNVGGREPILMSWRISRRRGSRHPRALRVAAAVDVSKSSPFWRASSFKVPRAIIEACPFSMG
jgi:hypothetical protein